MGWDGVVGENEEGGGAALLARVKFGVSAHGRYLIRLVGRDFLSLLLLPLLLPRSLLGPFSFPTFSF